MEKGSEGGSVSVRLTLITLAEINCQINRFWDWTLPVTGTEGLPQIFMDKNLSLLMPDGTTKIVDNILAFYDFGSQSQLPTGFKTVEESNPLSGETRYTSYFGDWTRTYRWPNSIKSDVIENYAELNRRVMRRSLKPVKCTHWSLVH